MLLSLILRECNLIGKVTSFYLAKSEFESLRSHYIIYSIMRLPTLLSFGLLIKKMVFHSSKLLSYQSLCVLIMYMTIFIKINLMVKRFISDINTRLTKNGSFLYNKSPAPGGGDPFGGSGLLKIKVNFINIDYLF
jgi:hypothetical protein